MRNTRKMVGDVLVLGVVQLVHSWNCWLPQNTDSLEGGWSCLFNQLWLYNHQVVEKRCYNVS